MIADTNSAPGFDNDAATTMRALLAEEVARTTRREARTRRAVTTVAGGLAVAALAGALAVSGFGIGGGNQGEPAGSLAAPSSAAWPTNANGETYGVAHGDELPDLLLASGVDDEGNPVSGYVRTGEVEFQSGAGRATEQLRGTGANHDSLTSGQDRASAEEVPLLASDGVTVIGTAAESPQ